MIIRNEVILLQILIQIKKYVKVEIDSEALLLLSQTESLDFFNKFFLNFIKKINGEPYDAKVSCTVLK